MHIGGFHFIYGLSFLFLTILLSTAYVYCAYILFVALESLLYRYRKTVAMNKYIAGRGPNPDESVKLPKNKFISRSFLIKALILISVLQSVVYIGQRIHWMGSESAHYEAKEYWAAGQVVFAHRKIAEKYLHPENPITWPYTELQKSIYKRGTALLPEDDGEVSVWQNQWFLYPYTRKSRRPYGVGDLKDEPKMLPLLDACWETLEKIATMPYSDKKMKRQYLLSFPALASYYNTHDGHYKGKFFDSSTLVRKDQVLIRRITDLLKWSDDLESKWDEEKLRPVIYRKYPGVASTNLVTKLRIIQDLILSKSLNNTISCNDPLISRMYDIYDNAMTSKPDKNIFVLYKRKNKRQAKIQYESAFYGTRGCLGRYLMKSLCHISLPEEKYYVVKESDHMTYCSDSRTKNIYKEELKSANEWKRRY